eukprot:CAMPEP_0170159256 /NCGR_PEP_ID=MMETSP0033_2-20121228/70297_1 /TAXON_ID=195969 /ORGANISM="Dolichomastix tenuilepis, Strain CCMP3274" /LENGTH=44 /DNA_ID= /DNA_START= /DNA_END= /DNA_ORIENTATION=
MRAAAAFPMDVSERGGRSVRARRGLEQPTPGPRLERLRELQVPP